MTGEDAARIVQSIIFVLDNKDYSDEVEKAIEMAVKALRQLPNDDENYVVLWEKAQWERDVAVEQLEQLGYSLGEKIRISDDCISRESVNTLVDELARAISDERCCISRGRSTATIMQDILDLSSVTPKPNTGHWIKMGEGFTPYECSECVAVEFKKSKYCPRCGSKMGEGEE